ncbi:MAG: DUF937 domain-containing protein [Bacteroidota bacterium]
MNILDLIGSLSGNTVDDMSSAIGAKKENTSSALMKAVPLIVGALARNSRSEEGANSLGGALDRDHDGGILGMLGGLFSNPESGHGAGILKHVLGDKRQVAEEQVSQKSGLDMAQTAKLMMMVAPMVMGFLGKKKKEENLDNRAVAGLLNTTAAQQEADEPEEKGGGGVGSFVTNLLDRDGDGNVMDDIGGIVGGLFGGRS